jgi:uncharacterized protein YndB with AHSA1/START domain
MRDRLVDPAGSPDYRCRGETDQATADETEVPRVISASREIAAGAERIFALIADPLQQPLWDANDNLVKAPAGQRLRGVGNVFAVTTTKGNVRENHMVEFEEGRRIPDHPRSQAKTRPGHLWRWELELGGRADALPGSRR